MIVVNGLIDGKIYIHEYFGPPRNVRASGTCPLNSAPLKSNPGFYS